MAKKRKSSKKSKEVRRVSRLPAGFWPQVGAVGLIALALLLVVAWFGSGGPVLAWLNTSLDSLIGYALYILPALFIFIAIEIFRDEDNHVSWLTKFTTPLLIIWFSGLFGLYQNKAGVSTGGLLGEIANKGMLALVDSGVGAFIYILLIMVTLSALLKITPSAIIEWFKMRLTKEEEEFEENAKVMKKASSLPDKSDKNAKIDDLKLNAGVPLLTKADKLAEEKSRRQKASAKPAEQSALVMASDPNWKAPSLDLLMKNEHKADPGNINQNAEIIRDTLAEFSIDVKMEGANVGPKVTQYTLSPPSGVKLARITALETNLALSLAAQSLRIEAPIPGQKAVGIEVPNKRAADVRLYGVLNSGQWKTAQEPLSFVIGKDISGSPVVGKLNKMPHLLIAGQTGSGKSVMINTLLTSLLYRNSPSDMKLILVDPKQVEMKPYEDIPHLLAPVITEPDKTISALKWAVKEMERRYTLLADEMVRDIASYNKKMQSPRKFVAVEDENGLKQEVSEGKMPYIVIVIDELADLMMNAAKDAEALIVRLAQKSRAVGIHLVLATQRPSVNVITGVIKANIPARIAFTVTSQVDSRTIIDQMGAEKLLGQGDMLLKTAEIHKPARVQGAWVMDEEVLKITDYLREQAPPQYNDEIISQPVQLNGKGGVVMDFDNDGKDDMYQDAVRVVVEGRRASTSLLQRRLRVGYGRASNIIEMLEEDGVIGPSNGSKPREVLISSMDEFSSIADNEEA